MNARVAVFMLVTLLPSCASKAPVIKYERSEFGLPVACVQGEAKCRELTTAEQTEIVRDLCQLYGCMDPP